MKITIALVAVTSSIIFACLKGPSRLEKAFGIFAIVVVAAVAIVYIG